MHQNSTSELNCQNCLANYQRFEESQIKLKEALRKIEKLDSQEHEPMVISGDDSEKIELLVQENKQLKMRVEQLDEKVKAGFVQNL